MSPEVQILHDVSVALAKEAKVTQTEVILKLMRVPRYRSILESLSRQEVSEVLDTSLTAVDRVFDRAMSIIKHPKNRKTNANVKEAIVGYIHRQTY